MPGVLKYFDYGHLPEHLQPISKRFSDLANDLVHTVTVADYRQMDLALTLLLQAKDAAVRSALPVLPEERTVENV